MSNKKSETYKLYGVELVIEYFFYKSEPKTLESPYVPAYIEYVSIKHDDVDIFDLLSNSVIEKIEEYLLDKQNEKIVEQEL